MLNIIYRRFENISIQVLPVKVQGDGSAEDIVEALKLLNDRSYADVAIIARGGGSLEDLQPFNSEAVARAIFASSIPIISAVGHETDFTIADFVADLRAPTPSAAAELAVPVKRDLKARCMELESKIALRTLQAINVRRDHMTQLQHRLIHPKRKIEDHRLRLDDLTGRLKWLMMYRINQNRDTINWRHEKLISISPLDQSEKLHLKLDRNVNKLRYLKKIYFSTKRNQLQAAAFRLEALNPAAILTRGYSITRTIPDNRIVQDAGTVTIGQPLSIKLAKGSLVCRVEENEFYEKKHDV
jgi:exodeoxyribonuclease VII large subunit